MLQKNITSVKVAKYCIFQVGWEGKLPCMFVSILSSMSHVHHLLFFNEFHPRFISQVQIFIVIFGLNFRSCLTQTRVTWKKPHLLGQTNLWTCLWGIFLTVLGRWSWVIYERLVSEPGRASQRAEFLHGFYFSSCIQAPALSSFLPRLPAVVYCEAVSVIPQQQRNKQRTLLRQRLPGKCLAWIPLYASVHLVMFRNCSVLENGAISSIFTQLSTPPPVSGPSQLSFSFASPRR